MNTPTRLILKLLLALVSIGTLEAKDQKPNIVLLYIDDWAWNGSSVAMHPDMPNSKMPVVQMPNIDRLAREGMVFQNAYGSPQCSPARACILTGQTSARNGFTVYMNPRDDTYYDTSKEYDGFKVLACVANKSMEPKNTFGIPKALAPLGYESAHIGKWHMRSDPGEHGYSVHDGDTDNNPGNTIKIGLKKGEDQPRRLTEENMADPKLMFSITDKAISFTEQQANADKPFYVQLSHYAMHAGSECKVATREKYVKHPLVQAWYKEHGKTEHDVARKEDPAVWLGMADDMDGRIGAVLDKLDELGIADNTYVVMVADNGYRHEFFPGKNQPLHARKWWVWEGGIRVPMIVKGPGIKEGSHFTGNVVNYDLLPTFVDWAGGDPGKLKDIDGVSLASYMKGEKPDEAFQNRNLHFHYPHYRGTMPHTAMVTGNTKIMHFWGHDEVPMMFDLSKDVGEVRNIAAEQPKVHERLFGEMMGYLKEVGARLPKTNPDYDPEKYRADKDYWYRVNWGPFKGKRLLDDDEQGTITASPDASPKRPQIQFTVPENGASLAEGSDLRVEIDVSGAEIEASKLYLNGMLINAQGMVSAPTSWSPSGDYMLSSLPSGTYNLLAIAKGINGRTSRNEIQITVGNGINQSHDPIYRILLHPGEQLVGGKALKFPRLEALLKLEENGKLMLRDEINGKLFEVPSKEAKDDYHASVIKGQLTIYKGRRNKPEKIIWQSPNPSRPGNHLLALTKSKELAIIQQSPSGNSEIIWKSTDRR